MLIAMGFFVANDALVKYLGQSLGGSQVIFIRGVISAFMLFFVARAFGLATDFSGLRDKRVLGRTCVEAFASMAYLTSLFHLPLANATAINMASPVVITLLAVVFLSERVSGGRWIAVAAGFGGVLMVVQPAAAGFNQYALLCVGGMLLYSLRDFLTRFIAPGIPSVVIAIASAIGLSVLSGIVSIFQGWKPVHLEHVALLFAAGACVSGAFYMLIRSMRVGEMSVIAPFRYTALLFALAVGYVVWGDVPNALAWGGIALLVGAGIYVLHSERMRQREAALDAAHD